VSGFRKEVEEYYVKRRAIYCQLQNEGKIKEQAYKQAYEAMEPTGEKILKQYVNLDPIIRGAIGTIEEKRILDL
jgi:hypothetical protein